MCPVDDVEKVDVTGDNQGDKLLQDEASTDLTFITRVMDDADGGYNTEAFVQHAQNSIDHYVTIFSANNVTEPDKSNNAKVFDEVWQVVDGFMKQPQLLKLLSLDALANYLYLITSCGHYKMFQHNGLEARQILLFGKSLILQYCDIVEDDFNQLTMQQQYSELETNPKLAKMYARIVYALGRTYVYQGGIQNGEKDFEIAEFFGKALCLFDGVLSVKGGIGYIKNNAIDQYIEQQDFEEAIKRTKDLIKLYQELKDDDREYILEYKPNIQDHKTIIPKDNYINKILCLNQILTCSNKLFKILDKEQIVESNLEQEIFGQIRYLVDEFDTIKNKVLDRQSGGLYNNVGHSLLILSNRNIEIAKELRESLCAAFLPEPVEQEINDSFITEQIFLYVVINSNDSDFTKADAYNGLAEVTGVKISQDANLTDTSLQHLTQIKQQFIEKRDAINKALNRNVKY